jgi:hypothetical protein
MSREFLEKYSNIKFHENPSSWSRVVACGRTDRNYVANSLFSQFCKRVQKGTGEKAVLAYMMRMVLTVWGELTFC